MLSNSTNHIDPKIHKALRAAGLDDVNMLRNAADVLSEADELAELLGVDRSTFGALINQSDLQSIRGLGDKYIGLLRAIGVNSTSDLRKYDPFELHAKVKVAAAEYSVGRIPNRATLEDWIEQAQ